MLTRLIIVSVFLATTLPTAVHAADAPSTQPGIVVDKEKKTITVPCKVAPRQLEHLVKLGHTEIYPIEVVATLPAPKGQKAHETVLNFNVAPSDVHKALESLGLKPGKPAYGEGPAATGPEVKIYLELPTPDGSTQRIPLEKSLVDKKTGKTMPTVKWLFTGSAMRKPDPTKDELAYGADLSGTLIGIFPITNETVIQTNLRAGDEKLLKMETNKKLLPPEGTPLNLIIEVK